MPQVLRQVWVCLAVVVMIVAQGINVSNAQHRVEHAVQMPAFAFADVDGDDHYHEHEERSSEQSVGVDQPSDPSQKPIHHHHTGGDVQFALGELEHATAAYEVTNADLTPGIDLPFAGAKLDAPSAPPRQLRA